MLQIIEMIATFVMLCSKRIQLKVKVITTASLFIIVILLCPNEDVGTLSIVSTLHMLYQLSNLEIVLMNPIFEMDFGDVMIGVNLMQAGTM